MTIPLAAVPAAPPVADVLGETLHVGSVVVDVKGGPHTIDRLAEYPGRFVGDHARVAYGDHWERTIPDHKPFHVQQAREGDEMGVEKSFRPATLLDDVRHYGVLVAQRGDRVRARTVTGADSRALVEIQTSGGVVSASPYDVKYEES